MIQLVVFLTIGEAGFAALEAYERNVLPILQEHGGRLITAMRPERTDKQSPGEIHVIEFQSRAGLTAYQQDPRITALAEKRAEAISSTRIFLSDEIISY